MTKDLSVSLSIQLKHTDAKERVAEIGKEFERLTCGRRCMTASEFSKPPARRLTGLSRYWLRIDRLARQGLAVRSGVEALGGGETGFRETASIAEAILKGHVRESVTSLFLYTGTPRTLGSSKSSVQGIG